MPLVKLRRNWFAPGGVRYRARDGLHQVSQEVADQAPSDAIVYDDNGKTLPSRSPVPRPGHGAKPLEEQMLDLIPGAAPTHMIRTTGPVISPPQLAPLSEEEQKKLDAEREAANKEAAEKVEQKAKEEKVDEQEKIDAGLATAEKVAEQAKPALDPVAAASTPGKAPAPTPPKK